MASIVTLPTKFPASVYTRLMKHGSGEGIMQSERPQENSGRKIKRVENIHILPTMLKGFVQNAIKYPYELRYSLIKSCFTEFRLFSSPNIKNIELADIKDIENAQVTGGITKKALGPIFDSFVLSALTQVLDCKNIFEIGTYLGETAWLLAHNKPDAKIYTLDFQDVAMAGKTKFQFTDRNYLEEKNRGTRYLGTPEQSRITQLYGDSATFDYSPYYDSMDLVFIDASHSYTYVKSDSENAFKMLSSYGTIVWDDYTYYPGIYAYLNEVAPELDQPIMHIRGTRLALYSRSQINTKKTNQY
jgi:predicted O-methyltransferase YrrM